MGDTKVNVKISLTDQLTKGFKNMSKSFVANAKKIKDAGKAMSLALTAPILLVGASMLQAASDAEETGSKFDTIFKDMRDDANKTADTFARDFGLAGSSARALLGDTADLLTGLNFTQESALDLSAEVNALAVDLASFTNFSGGAEGASQALTKGLLGERDAMKSLGIVVSEEMVQLRILENNMAGLTFETEIQAKAFATLTIAQEQSKNAIGDYSRTSESAANVGRRFKEQVKALREEFGKHLLPVFVKVISGLSKMVTWFGSLDDNTKTIILVVAGLVAALGPLVWIIGAITTAVTALSAALAFLALNPIVLIIASIAALGASLVWLWHNSEMVNKFIRESLGVLFDDWVRIFNGVRDFLVQTWDSIRNGIITAWEGIKFFFTSIITAIVDIVKFPLFFLVGLVTTMFEQMGIDLAEVFNSLVDFFVVTWELITLTFTTALNKILKFWNNTWTVIKTSFMILWNGIKAIATEGIGFFVSLFSDSVEAVSGAFGGIWEGAKTVMVGIFESMKGIVKGVINWIVEKINWIIDKINFISKAAAILPGVSVSDTQIAHIPMLANGGIVTKPTLAMIGEGGPEAVIPLSGRGGGVGGTTVIMKDNTFLDEDAAEKMGDMFLKKLPLELNAQF